MPSFPGLTREAEEEEEDHAKLQLLSLLGHKQEHRFFSSQLQELINPKFKPKPEADPEWKPGTEPFYFQRRRPRTAPSSRRPARAPGPSSPSPPPQAAAPEEEEPSTNMEDFASYYENLQ